MPPKKCPASPKRKANAKANAKAKAAPSKKRGGDGGNGIIGAGASIQPYSDINYTFGATNNPINQGGDVYSTITPSLGNYPTWNNELQQLGGRKRKTKKTKK